MNNTKRKMVSAILEMAMQCPSEVADIFVRYSPHVEAVTVEIWVGGWDAENASTKAFTTKTAYLDNPLLEEGYDIVDLYTEVRDLIKNETDKRGNCAGVRISA